MIPKVIHIIWLGNSLPDRYVRNVKLLEKHFSKWGKGWIVILWVENAFVIKNQVKFMNTPKIKIKSIKKDFFNIYYNWKLFKPGIYQYLTRLRKFYYRELAGIANYAAASDILRLLILYFIGGYYFDTDVFPAPGCQPNIKKFVKDQSKISPNFKIIMTPMETMVNKHPIESDEYAYPGSITENHKRQPRLDCWAMGADPKHNVIKEALLEIDRRVKKLDKIIPDKFKIDLSKLRRVNKFFLNTMNQHYLMGPIYKGILNTVNPIPKKYLMPSQYQQKLFSKFNNKKILVIPELGIATDYDNLWRRMKEYKWFDTDGGLRKIGNKFKLEIK